MTTEQIMTAICNAAIALGIEEPSFKVDSSTGSIVVTSERTGEQFDMLFVTKEN